MEKCIDIDWEKQYYQLREEFDCRMQEMEKRYEYNFKQKEKELDEANKRIKLYEDMIKSILHIS